MGIPQSNSFRFTKMLAAAESYAAAKLTDQRPGDFSVDISPDVSLDHDESAALGSLKELIEAREHGLDELLTMITDVARQLTGAPGAAVAMWKDSAMVCRARSGDVAPVLGAPLAARSGISGECLRSGKVQHCTDTENDPLVDVEVCRRLGLRSLAAFPIHGWRGINGVLAIFSSQPAAFTEKHIVLLQELAAQAERARSAQPQDASPPDRRLSGERR